MEDWFSSIVTHFIFIVTDMGVQNISTGPDMNHQQESAYPPCSSPILHIGDTGESNETPEKQGSLGRNRYVWGPDSSNVSCNVNGTPNKACRALGAARRGPSDFIGEALWIYGGCTRPSVVGCARGSRFVGLSKRVHVSYNTYMNINSADVPHFDLKEDPYFWMDYSVKVLIRVRLLNGMEISSQGYNGCLKQESSQGYNSSCDSVNQLSTNCPHETAYPLPQDMSIEEWVLVDISMGEYVLSDVDTSIGETPMDELRAELVRP
ncbi:kinesin-like protein KIN-12D [Tanacetum coccineum]